MTHNNGILKHIALSSDPLCAIRDLKESGICLRSLNTHAEFNTLLCDIIRRSYGMGLKLLIDCELDLSVHDPLSGDSPLTLVCMEGLCGPTKKLFEHLPWYSLLHLNHSGSTAMEYLLKRGHGCCGCLEALLSRLPLSTLLLPRELSEPSVVEEQTLFFNSLRSKPMNGLMNGLNFCSSNEHPLKHTVNNVVLLSLSDLLERIRSHDPRRLISVIQLWIWANLLVIPTGDNRFEQYDRNFQSLAENLIFPLIYTRILDKHLVDELIQLLNRLIMLNQLDSHTVWFRLQESLADQQPPEENSYFYQSIRFAANTARAPLPLRSLVGRQLRLHFQKRFVERCMNVTGVSKENALAFTQWVTELPVPGPVISHILLSPIDFSDLY